MLFKMKASSNVATKRVNKWPGIRHSPKKQRGNTFHPRSMLLLNAWLTRSGDLNNRIYFSNATTIIPDGEKTISCYWSSDLLLSWTIVPVKPFQIPVAAAVAPPGSVLELVSLVRSCCGSLRTPRERWCYHWIQQL